MGHVRISGTELKIRSGIGPIFERSERSCIRNRSGVGRAERGLVSRKDGGRSGRAGFERVCIRDTARIQRVLIGGRYALRSEGVIFYPIIPDQAIKLGRERAGVGRASGVNVALVGTPSAFGPELAYRLRVAQPTLMDVPIYF